MVSIVLFTFPGVVQAVWSEGGRLGDVSNDHIRVGSVLVSLLSSILYRRFNTTVLSVNTLRGSFLPMLLLPESSYEVIERHLGTVYFI